MRFFLAPELLEDAAVALDEETGSLRVAKTAGEAEREIKVLLRDVGTSSNAISSGSASSRYSNKNIREFE